MGDFMKHLGRIRQHSAAFTRGKNDATCLHVFPYLFDILLLAVSSLCTCYIKRALACKAAPGHLSLQGEIERRMRANCCF